MHGGTSTGRSVLKSQKRHSRAPCQIFNRQRRRWGRIPTGQGASSPNRSRTQTPPCGIRNEGSPTDVSDSVSRSLERTPVRKAVGKLEGSRNAARSGENGEESEDRTIESDGKRSVLPWQQSPNATTNNAAANQPPMERIPENMILRFAKRMNTQAHHRSSFYTIIAKDSSLS